MVVGAELPWGLQNDWTGRAVQRSDRFLRTVMGLRERVVTWGTAKRADPRFRRFGAQFDALDSVMFRMLDVLEESAGKVGGPSGEVYGEFRSLEASLLRAERMFDWYADKYDQRERADVAEFLRAADELVLSCWSQAFSAAPVKRPTGPLVFVEAAPGPCSLVRRVVPAALDAPGDRLLKGMIEAVPIPTIMVPPRVVDESWWLVLAAHETGHHVYYDLFYDRERKRDVVTERIAEALPDRDEDEAVWGLWALEVFADTFAALMVGQASSWAVAELIHGPAAAVAAPARDPAYPRPLVRVALIAEVLRLVGTQDIAFGAAEAQTLLESLSDSVPETHRLATARHLNVAPRVAEALATLPLGNTTMIEACAPPPGAFAPRGRVDVWTEKLAQADPVYRGVDLHQRAAARLAIAAGVRAYLGLAVEAEGVIPSESQRRLSGNLVRLLTQCTTPGVLRYNEPTVDLDAAADQLIELLLESDFPAEAGVA